MNAVNLNEMTAGNMLIDHDYLVTLGNLNIEFILRGQEWQLAYSHQSLDNDNQVNNKPANRYRLIVNSENPSLELRLRLANRPIVSRPQEKLFLAPNAKTKLFLTTALWLSVCQGTQTLLELPSQILSDIWFGPNTRQGELAYSNNIAVMLNPPNAASRAGKALTELTITNSSAEQLSLEKINLPIPELKLYRSQDGFCSDKVDIVVDQAHEAHLNIKPNSDTDNAIELLSQARKAVSRSALTRAVDVLFA